MHKHVKFGKYLRIQHVCIYVCYVEVHLYRCIDLNDFLKYIYELCIFYLEEIPYTYIKF